MNDKRKLYNTLIDKKLYSKSYEEFIEKYSNKEAVSNMYKVVFDKKLYSKEEDSFYDKYFSD